MSSLFRDSPVSLEQFEGAGVSYTPLMAQGTPGELEPPSIFVLSPVNPCSVTIPRKGGKAGTLARNIYIKIFVVILV